MTVRLLIVDDHRLVRAGLRLLLADQPGLTVIGEAAGGHEALAACDTDPPDLVLMDIAMPDGNGLDALAEIKACHPAVRVLILSMLASEEHVLQALRLGAAGYLLKDAAPAELVLAIEAALRGETWLSSAISRPVVDGYVARVNARDDQGDDPLTPRQQQVLRLLAEGVSTRHIASRLGVSVKTIETHRAQIMARLDLHDLAALVRYAVRQGMIKP